MVFLSLHFLLQKKAKIPLQQRVYDKTSFKTLLAGLKIKNVIFYARDEYGLWEEIDSQNTPEFKNIVECIALINAQKSINNLHRA